MSTEPTWGAPVGNLTVWWTGGNCRALVYQCPETEREVWFTNDQLTVPTKERQALTVGVYDSDGEQVGETFRDTLDPYKVTEEYCQRLLALYEGQST